ncbi:MAG: tetratricopeptide repeat protein [Oligoflexia bacterium]|nr:tetratricopeptide repeat protein [Oligoflexia bacterium]
MKKKSLVLTLFLAGLMGSPVYGQRAVRKKTVADVLESIDSNSRGQNVQLRKQSIALPEVKQTAVQAVPLSSVKPPSSREFFMGDETDEGKLEKITDEGINELYRLTKRYTKSKNRGELWLRLAELYVEKAKYIEYRIQKEYDVKLARYLEKKGPKPKLSLSSSQEYNKKAITLYQWFLRDFPKDQKIDQALFFLGYNHVEMGQIKQGVSYYQRLVKEHPNSPYIGEAHFALGEYYFENDKWSEGLKSYSDVLKNPRARLYSFALYKIAWCQYRMGRVGQGLKTLEQVIKLSRTSDASQTDGRSKPVSKIRLGSEALKDAVLFYADVGNYAAAKQYFMSLGGEKAAWIMLEKLAYLYSDTGRKEPAQYVFKQLLDHNATAPRAFDYQYQIVKNFSTSRNQRVYRDELFNWVDNYGPDGAWGRANAGNEKLMADAYTLRESALRNYTLLLHKNAQNSTKKGDFAQARESYQLYLVKFKDSPKNSEMHFFFSELLYAMGEFENAGRNYRMVADKDPKGKYFEPSVLNSVLSLEKGLKTDEQMKKVVGDSLQPVAFGEVENNFVAAAEYYIKTFPRGEKSVDVKFKVGRLHYSFNHFDEALKTFKQIVSQHPKTPYAVYSANLILDIFNLRKDYDGLAREGQDLIKNPALASQGFSADVREVVEKVDFKKAQDLELAKKYEDSARAFALFAKKYPKSALTPVATFNAGVNYERAYKFPEAIVSYSRVVATPPKKGQEKSYYRSLLLLGKMYEQTGQYDKAALQFERYAKENPGDRLTPDLYYNSALIWEGQKEYYKAINSYEKYYNSTKRKDRASALFKIAQIKEQLGQNKPAIEAYEHFLSSGPTDGEQIVEAVFRIGELHSAKGRVDDATKAYQRTVATEKSLTAKSGRPVGLVFAAEAKFKLAERVYDEFASIRIPANPAKQGEAIQQKLQLLTKLNGALAEVIKYDEGNMVIASLAKLGLAYDHISKALWSAPVPKGLNPQEVEAYKKGVDQVALPLKAKAVENFTSAINKSYEINYYNKYTRLALNKMGEFVPDKFAEPKEIVSSVSKADDMGLMP